MHVIENIEELLRLLSSADSETEADVIGQLVMGGSEVIDRLIPYLGHQDTMLCAMAAKALGRLARNDGEFPQRQRVLSCLEGVVETGNALVVLHAAEAMLYLGGRRDWVASRLAWVLTAEDMDTRLYVLDLLGQMEKGARPALPALLRFLVTVEELEEMDASEREVCWRSAAVIGDIGEASAEAMPILQTWLTSRDPMVRAVAACTIAGICPDADDLSLPMLLIEALASDDEDQRCYGAIGCHRLGPLAVVAIPGLARVIDAGMADPDCLARNKAILALGEIPESVPVLTKFLEETDPKSDYRLLMDAENACAMLAAIGAGAEAAVPVLRRWARVGDHYMQFCASAALWSITKDTGEALATAMAWLGDEDGWVKCRAADLLGMLGTAARSTVADLQRLLAHDDEHVRCHAEEALKRIMAEA